MIDEIRAVIVHAMRNPGDTHLASWSSSCRPASSARRRCVHITRCGRLIECARVVRARADADCQVCRR